MTLRLVTIFFFIGVFLSGITLFFFHDISPFRKDKLEELILVREIEDKDFDTLNAEIKNLISQGLIVDYLSPNAYVGFFLVLSSVFMFALSIHLAVDKLFFRKFFEKPSLIVAIRRSFLLTSALAILIYLSLLAVLNTWLLLAVIASVLIVDYLLQDFGERKSKPHAEIQEEER
ncbi:MAG: hypothetical protein Kow0081_1400 [Candidatus Dojkabacteria bacterium]